MLCGNRGSRNIGNFKEIRRQKDGRLYRKGQGRISILSPKRLGNGAVKNYNMGNLKELEARLLQAQNEVEKLRAGIERKKVVSDFPKSIEDLPKGIYHNVPPSGHAITTEGYPDFLDLPTEKAAISQKAANQLACLIHRINGGEVPETGYSVKLDIESTWPLQLQGGSSVPYFLRFVKREDAVKSVELHANLWRAYYTGIEQ